MVPPPTARLKVGACAVGPSVVAAGCRHWCGRHAPTVY